jgi:lipopolysaccharide biosynthesis protein
MKVDVPGVTVVNRQNNGHDFGAWSQILLEKGEDGIPRYQKYDFFVLLNSTIRGPFFPVWQKDRN